MPQFKLGCNFFLYIFSFSLCQAVPYDRSMIRKISTPNEELVRRKALIGFYPEDPIAIIEHLKSPTDCSLLCSRYEKCVSVNIVKIEGRLFICFLHESTLKKSRLITKVRIGESIYFELSSNGDTNLKSKVDHGPATPTCGIGAFTSTLRRTKRIIGGCTVEPHSQPWLGIIAENKNDICGISLIAKKESDISTFYGISAAHCFFKSDRTSRCILSDAIIMNYPLKNLFHTVPIDKLGFLFGLHDLRILTPHTVLRKAKRIHINPDFDAIRVQNDLALVEFTKKITFNDYVRPICLPPEFELQRNFKPFENCFSCGWGVTGDLNGPNSLNCIKIPEKLSPFEGDLHRSRHIHKMAYIKWHGALKGSYYGDSGGPYVCRNNEKDTFVLYGVSSGFIEARADRPYSYNVFSIAHLHLK